MIGGFSTARRLGEVVDGLDDVGLGDRRRVGAQRLDLDLEAGVGGGEHGQALGLVVGHPVLPAAGGDPQAVDQDNGVGAGVSFTMGVVSLWGSGVDELEQVGMQAVAVGVGQPVSAALVDLQHGARDQLARNVSRRPRRARSGRRRRG